MSVSIIIPCFRNSRTLRCAIESAINQSYPLDEIIVVNDASPETKEIEAIVSDYPNIKYFLNKSNLGLSATRNIGAKLATSDVICFLDADDEIHPQKIEFQMSLYNSNSAFFCDCYYVNNLYKNVSLNEYNSTFKYKTYKSSKYIALSNKLTGASLLVSRSLFFFVGGYDRKLKACEDYDLSLRFLDLGVKLINIKLPLYIYRNNPNGLSKKIYQISYWEWIVIKKYLKKKHISNYLTSSEETFILFIWILKHCNRFYSCKNLKLKRLINHNIKSINHSLFAIISLTFLKYSGILLAISQIIIIKRNLKLLILNFRA